MKRSCKNIDIKNVEIIMPWVYNCICRHYKRNDFRNLLCSVGGLSTQEYNDICIRNAKSELVDATNKIAKEATERIKNRNLGLPQVKIRFKIDRSTQKERYIGRESAMQQVFDYIAKESCEEIWKRRIAPQQMSSIVGRGPFKGTRMIAKWIQKDNYSIKWSAEHNVRYTSKCRYYVKLDIKKCFGSLRANYFFSLFEKDCGNDDILWLWKELIVSYRVPIKGGDMYEGFMIGALPSQWGCQYMMSFLFHYAMSLHTKRNGKQVKLIEHGLNYMDDFVFTGTSYKKLKLAVKLIEKYAREILGLEIKEGWKIFELSKKSIDMMGFIVRRDGSIGLRARLFLRGRRMALRYNRTRKMNLMQARRICSYAGYFANGKRRPFCVSTRSIVQKLNMQRMFNDAAEIVSEHDIGGMKNECCYV